MVKSGRSTTPWHSKITNRTSTALSWTSIDLFQFRKMIYIRTKRLRAAPETDLAVGARWSAQGDNDTSVQPQFTQWGRLHENHAGVRFPWCCANSSLKYSHLSGLSGTNTVKNTGKSAEQSAVYIKLRLENLLHSRNVCTLLQVCRHKPLANCVRMKSAQLLSN